MPHGCPFCGFPWSHEEDHRELDIVHAIKKVRGKDRAFADILFEMHSGPAGNAEPAR